MKIGTRTLLFGVHQFLWHPFTVWRAWRWLYGENPGWAETVAIFCHDLGYVGKPNLDGPEGKTHPDGGAALTEFIVRTLHPLLGDQCWDRYRRPALVAGRAAYWLSRLHSREYAKQLHERPSRLCWADKASILFDPSWFYLLRARLSGELEEFKTNAEPHIGKVTDEAWLGWYHSRVHSLLLDAAVPACDSALEDIRTGRR